MALNIAFGTPEGWNDRSGANFLHVVFLMYIRRAASKNFVDIFYSDPSKRFFSRSGGKDFGSREKSTAENTMYSIKLYIYIHILYVCTTWERHMST